MSRLLLIKWYFVPLIKKRPIAGGCYQPPGGWQTQRQSVEGDLMHPQPSIQSTDTVRPSLWLCELLCVIAISSVRHPKSHWVCITIPGIIMHWGCFDAVRLCVCLSGYAAVGCWLPDLLAFKLIGCLQIAVYIFICDISENNCFDKLLKVCDIEVPGRRQFHTTICDISIGIKKPH